MRIAHVITRMIIGGAQENTLLNCLDLMRHYGDDVLLITGPALGPEGDLLSQGRAGELPVKVLPSLRRDIHPKWDWLANREIGMALKGFNPDVVHTHSAKGGLLGRKVAWKMNVPAVIHTIHGAPFHPYQSALAREFFRRCERWASARCHHLISVADAMTDLMVEAGVAPPEKFTTIYSGMDVEPFTRAKEHRAEIREKFGFDDEHVVIGKIARLFHLKGHYDLIKAAVPVEEYQRTFLLVGWNTEIVPDAGTEELGLAEHFVFAGLVPPSDVPALLGGMDALVHASYREGLARALPQALIAGLPVISYDVDGAREVTITDETGILVPAQDVEKLSQALEKLASDSALRQRLGSEGQRRFTEQFDHHTMTSRVREVYLEQIAKN